MNVQASPAPVTPLPAGGRVHRTPWAAEYLGVSVATLNRWRSTGEGPEYIALSRRAVGYTLEALDRFKEARTRTRTAA